MSKTVFNPKLVGLVTEQTAFDDVKAVLTYDLHLTHYNLEKDLYMICVVSDYGIRAVLLHKMDDNTERPIIMGSNNATS